MTLQLIEALARPNPNAMRRRLHDDVLSNLRQAGIVERLKLAQTREREAGVRERIGVALRLFE